MIMVIVIIIILVFYTEEIWKKKVADRPYLYPSEKGKGVYSIPYKFTINIHDI